MKVGVYPGSFNPWHEGHRDILKKALEVFDFVIISFGNNPDKQKQTKKQISELEQEYSHLLQQARLMITTFDGLLVDHIKDMQADAVIRGLRNGHDLQYEMNQQYWNEDLGLDVPTVYFITDRKLGHISSSAIRAVEKLKDE